MPIIDPESGVRVYKIVLMGPALAGKTTCLTTLNRLTSVEHHPPLVSRVGEHAQMLSYDLEPTGSFTDGRRGVVRIVTLPGSIFFKSSWDVLLNDADAVWFVADSQGARQEANRDEIELVEEKLAANGVDLARLLMVFLYNRRDLVEPDEGMMSVERMELDLNPRGAPSFASVATTGEGVREAWALTCDRLFGA